MHHAGSGAEHANKLAALTWQHSTPRIGRRMLLQEGVHRLPVIIAEEIQAANNRRGLEQARCREITLLWLKPGIFSDQQAASRVPDLEALGVGIKLVAFTACQPAGHQDIEQCQPGPCCQFDPGYLAESGTAK